MTTPENASAEYKNQIRTINYGTNTITVGDGGQYATVAAAVAFINTQPRYTVIYSTGTATLTAHAKTMVPSGGAVWTGLGTSAAQEYWLHLDAAGLMIPLQGVAPPIGTGAPATSWGDYGELKFNYEGVTGDKSYEIVTPNWFNILLLAGETVDPVNIDWPNFVTLSGGDRESSMFRGSIHVDVGTAGIWIDNLSWGSINGVVHDGEEALVTVDDTLVSEMGYAQVIFDRLSCGKGNANRDVTYRAGGGGPLSHALFKSTNCDYYSHFDAIQCISREVLFNFNNIYIHTQDTTIFDPTGFRWFSGAVAPAATLFVDISNNNFFIQATAGARTAKGLILIDENASYLTSRPDVYGKVKNNYIEVAQDGIGDSFGIDGNNFLWGATNGRILVDGNVFDITSAGGTATHLRATSANSHFLWGKNNVVKDGSAFAITGAPLRSANHGLSAAIATGATIAHGLRAVPTTVSITPTGAKTDVYATVDATNITVNYGGGGTSTFHWKVEL